VVTPRPIASRVLHERWFRHTAWAMEPGGVWVFLSAHWTRWGARRALREFLALWR
jgi:hypothetical protein